MSRHEALRHHRGPGDVDHSLPHQHCPHALHETKLCTHCCWHKFSKRPEGGFLPYSEPFPSVFDTQEEVLHFLVWLRLHCKELVALLLFR